MAANSELVDTPDKAVVGEVVNIKAPTTEVEKRATALITLAKAQPITSADQCVEASATLSKIQSARRFITAIYKTARDPLIEAQRKLIAQEKALIDPLVRAERDLEGRILTFNNAERDRVRKLAEAATADATAKAVEEQQGRADALRKAAEAAPTKQARRALEKAAESVTTAQTTAEAIELPVAAQTLAGGVHERETFAYELVDLKALVLEVAAKIMLNDYGGKADKRLSAFLSTFKPEQHATLDCLKANPGEIGKLVKALKGDTRISGIKVSKNKGLVSRG
jgi:hypothetical protein